MLRAPCPVVCTRARARARTLHTGAVGPAATVQSSGRLQRAVSTGFTVYNGVVCIGFTVYSGTGFTVYNGVVCTGFTVYNGPSLYRVYSLQRAVCTGFFLMRRMTRKVDEASPYGILRMIGVIVLGSLG